MSWLICTSDSPTQDLNAFSDKYKRLNDFRIKHDEKAGKLKAKIHPKTI